MGSWSGRAWNGIRRLGKGGRHLSMVPGKSIFEGAAVPVANPVSVAIESDRFRTRRGRRDRDRRRLKRVSASWVDAGGAGWYPPAGPVAQSVEQETFNL